MSCLRTGNGTGARHASVPTNEEEALAVGCTAEQMAECKAKSAEHEVKLAAGLRTPRTTADYVKTWGNELRVDVSDAEGVGMGERFANKGKAPTHDVPGFADGVPAPVWNDAAHPKFVELDAPEDGGRIVIVGDVQGCFNEYNALMKLVNVTDRDIVVLVGDVVHSNSGVKPGPSGTLLYSRRAASPCCRRHGRTRVFGQSVATTRTRCFKRLYGRPADPIGPAN